MEITIVNIRRGDYTVKIDRTTQYGNPYKIGRDGTRAMVVAKHKLWLLQWLKRSREIIIDGYSNKWVCEHIHMLQAGKWGCWCTPKCCHGDNLLWLRNYLLQDTN